MHQGLTAANEHRSIVLPVEAYAGRLTLPPAAESGLSCVMGSSQLNDAG
jgi:hypothetical protein